MQNPNEAAIDAANQQEGPAEGQAMYPAPFASYFNCEVQEMLGSITEEMPVEVAQVIAIGAQANALLDVAQAIRELTSVAGQIATVALNRGVQRTAAPESSVIVRV